MPTPSAKARQAQRLRREIERLQRLTRLGVLSATDTDPRIAELEDTAQRLLRSPAQRAEQERLTRAVSCRPTR
jgi:hypothetical protein